MDEAVPAVLGPNSVYLRRRYNQLAFPDERVLSMRPKVPVEQCDLIAGPEPWPIFLRMIPARVPQNQRVLWNAVRLQQEVGSGVDPPECFPVLRPKGAPLPLPLGRGLSPVALVVLLIGCGKHKRASVLASGRMKNV